MESQPWRTCLILFVVVSVLSGNIRAMLTSQLMQTKRKGVCLRSPSFLPGLLGGDYACKHYVSEYVIWQKSECKCVWTWSKWNSFTKYYNAYALAALMSSLCRKTPSSSTHFTLKTEIMTRKIRSPDICTICCTWTSYHIDKNTSKAFVFLQTGSTVVWKERLYEHIKVDTVTAPWLVVKIS